MKTRVRHGPFHDEQGDWSFSRAALALVIPCSLVVIAFDVGGHVLSQPGYDYLQRLIEMLAGWAGLRASARYLQRPKIPDDPKGPEGQEGQ